jgi:hypothetical protein
MAAVATTEEALLAAGIRRLRWSWIWDASAIVAGTTGAAFDGEILAAETNVTLDAGTTRMLDAQGHNVLLGRDVPTLTAPDPDNGVPFGAIAGSQLTLAIAPV